MTAINACKDRIDIRNSKLNLACCSNPIIVNENGFRVCSNCGTVESRFIENRPRMAFSYLDKKERRLTEHFKLQIGPRTIISGNIDANGNYMTPKHISEFKRLAKIQRGYINGYERNVSAAFIIYKRLKSYFRVPDHIEKDVFKVYNIVAKGKMSRGRGIEALIVASLFCAFRINGIPIIIDDIVKNTNISKKEFFKGFKLIYNEVLPLLNFKIKFVKPTRYVDKLAEGLKLSMKCRNIAINLIESGEQHGLKVAGKDPKGIAAASLYLSAKYCDELRYQKDICKLAAITEVTMRARMHELIQLNPLITK
ncbi:MAG: transcription initiation factor IIB family protein [Promethearchaeota archaeon]